MGSCPTCPSIICMHIYYFEYILFWHFPVRTHYILILCLDLVCCMELAHGISLSFLIKETKTRLENYWRLTSGDCEGYSIWSTSFSSSSRDNLGPVSKHCIHYDSPLIHLGFSFNLSLVINSHNLIIIGLCL